MFRNFPLLLFGPFLLCKSGWYSSNFSLIVIFNSVSIITFLIVSKIVYVLMLILLFTQEHVIRTGRGSLSVIVYGDQDKSALITYPDLALNRE
jgi:hypothetical protein